jgi:hypothetical protein
VQAGGKCKIIQIAKEESFKKINCRGKTKYAHFAGDKCLFTHNSMSYCS